MKSGIYAIILLCSLSLPISISCTNDTYGDTYSSSSHHLNTDGWIRSDTVIIPISQSYFYKDSLSPHQMNVRVGVRYTDRYPYEALRLQVRMNDGQVVIYRDTIELDLSKRIKDGFSYREQTKILMQLQPDTASSYSLHISHLMGNDTIKGVSDIFCDVK